MKRILIILLLIVISPLRVNAETGLQLTPAFSELVVKPGEIVEGSFSLINNNEFDLNLGKSNGSISPDGTISLEDTEANAWIEYDKSDFKIESLKSFELKYKVSVPLGSTEGVYQPMIVLELKNLGTEDGSNASILQLLPFQFRIFVSQFESYNAELKVTNLNASNIIALGSSQTINFSVLNISPSPAKPLVRVQVVAPDGQITYQSVKNESLAVLLKDQSIADAQNISDSFNNESKLGRYNIELLVTDTLTNKSVVHKTSFIFIPQAIINLIIIVVLIILLITFFIVRRKYIPRKEKKEHVFKYK